MKRIEDFSDEELNNYTPESDSDAIVWNKNRPLKWEDFTGEPDPEQIGFVAQTNSIMYRKCDANVIEGSTGHMFQLVNIRSIAIFRKSGSWVRPHIIQSEKHAIILKHEQCHLDIVEIHARKLGRKLHENAKINYPCIGDTPDERQKYADNEVEKILKKLGNEIDKEERITNKKYEDETEHGKNLKEQGKWNLRIERLLKES